jgi:crotonobetainyl-CoA:carnitine CoA-transferase CaiB-like acyl-CoA transferase
VRTGEFHPNLAPYQPFPTQDGELVIAVGNDAQFQRFCAALGLQHQAVDERYATNPARVKHRESLVQVLKEATRKSSSRELMATLRSIKVPCGPIQTIAEVFDDPQVLARNMVVTVEHPELGAVTTVANPIKFSSTAVQYRKAPPRLGEDTDTVLAEFLGLSDTEISALKERGVV